MYIRMAAGYLPILMFKHTVIVHGYLVMDIIGSKSSLCGPRVDRIKDTDKLLLIEDDFKVV